MHMNEKEFISKHLAIKFNFVIDKILLEEFINFFHFFG